MSKRKVKSGMENKKKSTKKRALNEVKIKLTQISRFLSNKFEELFTNNKFTALVTLLLAVVLVQSIQSVGNIALIKQVSSQIRGREVTAEYDQDKFVVEGIPKTADIVIFGDEAAIQSTKTTKSYGVAIDLTGYGAGEHLVNLDVNNLPANITAQVNPSKVRVVIRTKEFKVFDVSPEIINVNSIEGLSIENPQLIDKSVSLKGSEKELKRVAFVRALIDGKAINSTLTEKREGMITARATVVAYDDQGEKIQNITVDGGTVEYSVELVAPKGKPINTLNSVFIGNFPDDKAIKSITLENEAVTINGVESETAKVSALNIRFDLKNVTTDGKITGNVEMPAGVNLMSITPEKISGNIEFGPALTTEMSVTSITPKNGDSAYNYAVEDSGTELKILVTGTAEQLALLSDELVSVTVNVANLGEGTHNAILEIEGSTLYRYRLNQENLRLRVTRA
ncbi:hypothetical protein AwErysi_08310 [Erysipelotrichaceae bacterium]|nr:hypothetical protein AwErysi_08310 [Erysipelotrichaceae bacterium]